MRLIPFQEFTQRPELRRASLALEVPRGRAVRRGCLTLRLPLPQHADVLRRVCGRRPAAAPLLDVRRLQPLYEDAHIAQRQQQLWAVAAPRESTEQAALGLP